MTIGLVLLNMVNHGIPWLTKSDTKVLKFYFIFLSVIVIIVNQQKFML